MRHKPVRGEEEKSGLAAAVGHEPADFKTLLGDDALLVNTQPAQRDDSEKKKRDKEFAGFHLPSIEPLYRNTPRDER